MAIRSNDALLQYIYKRPEPDTAGTGLERPGSCSYHEEEKMLKNEDLKGVITRRKVEGGPWLAGIGSRLIMAAELGVVEVFTVEGYTHARVGDVRVIAAGIDEYALHGALDLALRKALAGRAKAALVSPTDQEEEGCIKVWPFTKAPPELRALSESGDEDWLAVVPDTRTEYVPWLMAPNFGGCSVEVYQIAGARVYISNHA